MAMLLLIETWQLHNEKCVDLRFSIDKE